VSRWRTATGERRGRWRAMTQGELLGGVGRVLLWLGVVVVLVRGLDDVLASGQRPAGSRAERATATRWPDDAARALAVEFATAYLDRPADDASGKHAQTVAALAAPELADVIVPRLEPGAPGQTVRSAVVAEAVSVDARRALVTVAVSLAAVDAVRTVRLMVPVARDAAGRLVVDDLPSLAPTPALAAVGPVAGQPLLDGERAAIGDVLSRFLRAYLAGDAAGLAYFVPAGTRLGATSGEFELMDVTSLAVLGPAEGRQRVVLATVQARDRVAQQELALRYRVRLVRRDRWYVADLNPGGRP
jgi:hypothetical protein